MLFPLFLGAILSVAPDGTSSPPIDVTVPALPAPASTPSTTPAPGSAAPDRWLLMKALQGTPAGAYLDGSRTQISGWADVSYTTGTLHNALPLGFNYLPDPILDQVCARVIRSVVTTGTSEPTFGYEGEIIFGTDYRFTLPRGILDGQLTARHFADGHTLPANYGVDPLQFFGEANFPTVGQGLDIKVGRMITPFGLESPEAISTPFLSHSYTDFYSPFTVTGMLATLTADSRWTFQAGAMLGNDIFIDSADSPTFYASAQWTQPGGRNVIKGLICVGSGTHNINAAFNNFDFIDVTYTHIINSSLAYNYETIAGYESKAPVDVGPDGQPTLHNIYWSSMAQYLIYTVSPHLTGKARLELYDDPQGNRTSTFSGADPQTTRGLYTALTVGLNYQPRKAILFRPEIRFDYNGESRPFDGRHELFTIGSDMILRW